jgi:hypothetical protein
MNPVDISLQPNAFRAQRRPYLVSVEFAAAAGTLATMEGEVSYRAGDALLTGQEGERWPVAREQFFATYDPAASTQGGAAGTYRRRPGTVWAWRADHVLDIVLSDGRGCLRANTGDLVVQFDSGDLATMPEHIFRRGYAPLSDPGSEPRT